jgi:hypothetical protein
MIATAAADAQVVPEATGPRSLPTAGNLNYSVRYSESAEFGTLLGDWQSGTVSGSAGYANGIEHLPFSLDFGGGYTWPISGVAYNTGFYENLFLSQGFVERKWNLQVSDNVGYRRQTPTTGFSGVPGTGEPIGVPNPSPTSGESILTLNTTTVNNTATGEFQRTLSHTMIFNAGASSMLLRFPDANGLDSDDLTANSGLTWRPNARNSLGGTYEFSRFTYPGSSVSFVSHVVLATYTRQWTRRLNTTGGLGPEWIESSDSAILPSSIRVSANAGLTYQMRSESIGVNYTHGTNGGGGYLLGAELDSLNGNFSREYGKKLTVGITGSYMRTTGLNSNGVTNAEYGGAQATRRLGRYFNAFASYTAINQTSSSSLSANVLSGLQQIISFGIGYSPRQVELRH